jgi:ubiquinone biosynthesis protein
MTAGLVLGVRPEFLIFALFGVFLFTLGQALIARRLLRLQSGFLRVGVCGFVGLCVGGLALGPQFVAPGWQWPLIPIMWGLILAATMFSLLVSEALVPTGFAPVGVAREIRSRYFRIRRYIEVSRIAARNGLPRAAPRLLGQVDPGLDAQFAVALRQTLEECGATFVKLGQVLSTRRDLLPEGVITELAKLQTEVPAVGWPAVRELLLAEYDEEPDFVFRQIDHEPFAAASIAQVHAATLHDGRRVAVKIQRPGIIPIIERDLDIVQRIAATLERRFSWASSMRASELAGGFATAVREELDFRQEARNIASVSAAAEGHESVKIPNVHDDLSTARVLVMELIDGIPLGRAEVELNERHTDRTAVATQLLNVLLRQIMTDGVFHADPHPGNILLLPDDSIALLDFGSVGRLDKQLQAALQRLLLAIDKREPSGLRDALLEIADRGDESDMDGLERALGRFMSRHLGPGGPPDPEMFTDMFRLVSTRGLSVPPEVAAAFRALATVEGTLTAVSPGFDVVSTARKFAQDEVEAQMRPESMRAAVQDELAGLLPILRRLPRRIDRITADMEHGRFGVNLRLFSHADDRVVASQLVRQVLLALLAGVSGIIGALLLIGRAGPVVMSGLGLHEVLGYGFLTAAFILALATVFGRSKTASRR